MTKDNSSNQEIPGMNINNNYSPKKPLMSQDSDKVKKDIENKKKGLDKFKNLVLKKFKFVQVISILPPQALKEVIEEEFGEEFAKEGDEKFEKLKKKNHLWVVVPEEKYKEIPKIKEEIVKIADSEKLDVWVYVKTPVDIWEMGFDSKFEIVEAVSMSYPLHDDGLLAGLRVATIHKSLTLQKFDRYVVSYVVAGSIVRGDVLKTSDVDAFVIINDTDVKRMPRLELKERLRSMIHQFISEASSLAGVENNVLNVQVYLLTEFWEAVKDAQPVMFTFIRDGVPLYDKGTFMPWKALLKMGKLKPSPEAIDMFMSMGDNTIKRAKKTLLDIVIQDVYWGVVTPSQALLMLNGNPPSAPKHLVSDMKKVFVEKEKMLEKKYLNILEEVVKIYKDYEHEKIKEIKGAKVDKLIKNTEDYLKRLKELREQIEKRYNEKTIEQIYKDVFELLKTITGKKSQQAAKENFEKMIKQGKFAKQHSRALKSVIDTRDAFKKGKTTSHKIDNARKDAMILINDLIDYSQRCELANLEKGKFRIKYSPSKGKEDYAELLVCNDKSFLIIGNNIKKITSKGVTESTLEEFNNAVEKQKNQKELQVQPFIFEMIKKELGDFEIVI